MKIILSERQFNLIQEQWWNDPKHPEWKQYAPTDYERRELKKAETVLNNLDPHTIATIFQIGTAFIPAVGPFISAGIGLADAALYYKEGDKNAAGLTAALSMLPFAGKIVSKIPGVKQLGSKGMALLASKLSKGAKLVGEELSMFESIAKNAGLIEQELSLLSSKLSPLTKSIQNLRPTYILRYGQESYENLLRNFLAGKIDKNYFLKSLTVGQKAAPQLTNFVTKFGIKFTKNEIAQIDKAIANIESDAVDFVKIETKNGPKTIKIKKVDGDWVAKNMPDYTNSAGWADVTNNTVTINKGATQYYSKSGLEDLFIHEFGHIKDPSLIKSPVYQKLYQDEATKGIRALKNAREWENTNWGELGLTKPSEEIANFEKMGIQKYKMNPQEIIANNTKTLQGFSTQTKYWSEVLPKKQMLNLLDNIIGFAKGTVKSLSGDASRLIGVGGANHLNQLAKYKPSEYRKLLTKVAQQAEYLKSQIKIGN